MSLQSNQRNSTQGTVVAGNSKLYTDGSDPPCHHPRSAAVRISRLLLLLLGLTMFPVFPANHANAETVKITTGEWKPLISEESKHGGVILHIVREAFARKGIDVEIEFFPWARAEKYVDNGSWDAMAITSSRHSKGLTHLYSDAVYIGEDVLFHLVESPLPGSSFADLKGLVFGAVLSYDYTPEYREALEDGQITQVVAAEAELLFPMLAAKRFDVFIMDKTAGMYTYNTQYRGEIGDVITYLAHPLLTLEYSIRFSGDGEKSQRLVKIFNASLKEMREAGIIDHYYHDFELGYYLKP